MRPTASALKLQRKVQEEKRKKKLLKAGRDPRPEQPPSPEGAEAESRGPQEEAASEREERPAHEAGERR